MARTREDIKKEMDPIRVEIKEHNLKVRELSVAHRALMEEWRAADHG